MDMTSAKIAIITEASENVGTGHLHESLNLAVSASVDGAIVALFINREAPVGAEILPCINVHKYTTIADDIELMVQIIDQMGCEYILVNVFRIGEAVLQCLRAALPKQRIVCIDELGNRALRCDAVINHTIVPNYHHYAGHKELYTGPGYLIMRSGFAEKHKLTKAVSGEIRKVSIFMGGMDRNGVTLKVIDILSQWRTGLQINAIAGNGFRYLKELRSMASGSCENEITVYHNIDFIDEVFFNSDVAFTCGGDSLYELACVGTPAIILYEEEHEREVGTSFEVAGFGFCGGSGAMVEKDEVLSILNRYSKELREQHSAAGKKMVDGLGCQRVLKVLLGNTNE